MSRPVRWSVDVLTDLDDQLAYIAAGNPSSAWHTIDETALALWEMSIGRPGRVTDTYEKSAKGLPHILAYAIAQVSGEEAVANIRVIHAARDLSPEKWPD